MSTSKTYPSSNYYSTPRRDGPPRFIPFDNLNREHYVELDYVVHYAYFKQSVLNSQIAGYPGFYLVEETATSPAGNGIMRVTRTYAPIFKDTEEGESFSAIMPGLGGGVGGNPPVRDAIQLPATASRLVSKYFLLGVSLSDCSGGYYPAKYATPIPVVTVSDIPLMAPVMIVDASGNQTLVYSSTTPNVQIYGPFWIPDAAGTPGASATTLTQAQYWAKVVAAGGTWMVAESSKLQRVKGYLWGRTTRYTLAI